MEKVSRLCRKIIQVNDKYFLVRTGFCVDRWKIDILTSDGKYFWLTKAVSEDGEIDWRASLAPNEIDGFINREVVCRRISD